MHINYKPEDGWTADVIPFYWQGEYHLFYLKDYRDAPNHGEGYSWYHVGTRDLVHFTDYGEALAKGSIHDRDFYASTGSVIHAEGQFHIFYHGQNRHLQKAGYPSQAMMHAVSDDLQHWTKIPEHTWTAPLDRFEPHDWRDPFVFRNDDVGEYWMLAAARLKQGPSRRRGCTALCTSEDLVTWTVKEPLYAPDLYFTHECPDLFRMGDWWYLLFSEFSEAHVTRYRMARSLAGPWLAPPVDTFDGRAFYAAKTADGEGRRYLFGWNPTRLDAKDHAPWHWGGNLVVHEISQRLDGTLDVRVPDAIKRHFAVQHLVVYDRTVGAQLPEGGDVRLDGSGSFRCISGGLLPEMAMVEATATFTEPTKGFGVMLRASQDLENAYYARVEPLRGRLVFDSWPRRGDVPYMIEVERPLTVEPGKPVQFVIYVDGTLCEVYVNDQVAMSVRMYDHLVGNWGLFVSEGCVTFSDVRLSTPA